uniref:Symplekin n=1 Tax=Tetraselmis sp. GSL018 TaxID=582737 RepID=A0A061RAN6_9CHLO
MGEARLPEPSQDGKAEEAGGGDASGAAHATQEDPQLGEPFPDGAPQEEEHRGDPTPEEDRDAAGDPTGKETQENGRSFASESADGTAEAAAADPMEVENERGKEEGTQGDPMQTDPAEDTPSAAEVAQDAAARNEGAAPGAGDAGLAGTEADTAWPAAGAEPSAAPEGDNGNGEAAEGREGAGATSGGAAAAPEDDQLTDVPLVEVAGTRYEAVLLRLLRGLREASTPRDPSLIRLLQEAPVLPPESTSEFLASLVALGGQWAVAALKAAFDLLLQRPGLRKTCLRVILETTEAEDADIRNKAVRLIANRLFPERELMPSIEEHAAATLRRAADGDDPSAPQSAEDSARSCELYMALCTKKHILLRGLMETFGKGRPVLCQAIQKQARDLALTIGPSAAVLLSLVRRPPPGSELLLLHMLHVLTEDRLPPWELVAAAMDLYNAPEEEHELSGDVRFLGPVVGGMAQEDVRELLPQILTLGERPLQAAFARLLERRKGADEPLFSPAGLLVAIHDVAPVPASEGGPTLDQVKAGILLCLNNRRLFTKEELALTVQNLRQASTLPTLFMWTVINISRTAPDLVTFILQLLRDMIDKVWSQPQQRQGFVMCCKMMAPQSFPLLSELSPEMLRAAAGRLPRQTLQSLAAFLSSPSCKLPENRRRRAAEIVDAAATAAASGGPAAKAAPPRAEASPAAGSQQSKRPLEGAGEEGGGPNNKAGRHS